MTQWPSAVGSHSLGCRVVAQPLGCDEEQPDDGADMRSASRAAAFSFGVMFEPTITRRSREEGGQLVHMACTDTLSSQVDRYTQVR